MEALQKSIALAPTTLEAGPGVRAGLRFPDASGGLPRATP